MVSIRRCRAAALRRRDPLLGGRGRGPLDVPFDTAEDDVDAFVGVLKEEMAR
ncbi:hypothetical protein ACFYZ8_17500 [Streptomyces sp. NPDC001668]|uniref:hypothetical protein n=1 Tax=unclassified Streptomyces TaxID=2593676 RepID=UPI0036741F77